MNTVPGAATDPGLQRKTNEDRIHVDPERGVFLVVDGIGGHAAGEMAAQTALDVIVRELRPGVPFLETEVRRTIALANNEIVRLAGDNPQCAGMGCVLTLTVVRDGLVTVGHVGDSRLYLMWSGCLRKVTSDHSPIGEQEDLGEMTESEAMLHPRRNEIFRDLGSRAHEPDDPNFIEVKSFRFHSSAALLLCTDGLSDALTSAEMCKILETYNGDPDQIASALVESAKQRGGVDNISVVFIPGGDFLGAHAPEAERARARQAITRMRTGRTAWAHRVRTLLWLLVGIVLGILLWQTFERVTGGAQ